MAIYYVDPLSGSDVAAGTSFALAWATTQKAVDTIIAGDEVRLCNTATEAPSATVDFDNANLGTIAAPLRFIGADSSGVPLTSGFYTLTGTSLPAATHLIILSANNSRMIFDRIRATAATASNLYQADGVMAVFRNSRFDNAGTYGSYSTSTGGLIRMFNCEIDTNTSGGIGLNAAGRGPYSLSGGSIHDNTGPGARIGESSENTGLWDVLVYGNTDGLWIDSSGTASGCTIYDNSANGLIIEAIGSDSGLGVVVNNSFSGNGAYGISDSTASEDVDLAIIDNNHYHNNTSGETSFAATPGDNNQTGDPLFTNVTAGSEDFTPLSGSPLIRNGINNGNIGAVAPLPGGGETSHTFAC